MATASSVGEHTLSQPEVILTPKEHQVLSGSTFSCHVSAEREGRDGNTDSFFRHLGQNLTGSEADRFCAKPPYPTCQSPYFHPIAKAGMFEAQPPACVESGVCKPCFSKCMLQNQGFCEDASKNPHTFDSNVSFYNKLQSACSVFETFLCNLIKH